MLIHSTYLDAGEVLDVGGVDTLRERVLDAFEQTSDEVFLQCARLDFVDSSGLGLLVELEHEAQLRGARLILADPSRPLRELLALTGLVNVLDVDDQPRRPLVPGTPIGGFPIPTLRTGPTSP